MRYRTLVCASLLAAAMLCVPSVQVTAVMAADAMNGATDRMRNARQDAQTAIGDRSLIPAPTAAPSAAAVEATMRGPVSLRGASGAKAPIAPGGTTGEAQGVKSVRNGLRVDTDQILSR